MTTKYKIWYMHQLGTKAFEREVPDPATGQQILDTIYNLMLSLFDNRMIPDYANVGGVVELDEDGEWTDYEEE